MKTKSSEESILFVGVLSFIISMILLYFFWGPEGILWMSYLVVCPVISGIVALISIFVYTQFIANRQNKEANKRWFNK